jgi:hypothetical protein
MVGHIDQVFWTLILQQDRARLHGCVNWVRLTDAEAASCRLKVSLLVDGYRPSSSITFDLKPQEPLELTKVSDVEMLTKIGLELFNHSEAGAGKDHIVG